MRTLAIALALVSTSALACPNLAGTYATCRSTTGASTGSTDVVVAQKVVNGVTVYSVTSTDDESQERETEEMIADGKTRTETESSPETGEIVLSATYKCSGDALIGTQSVVWQNAPVADIDQNITKSGNTLTIAISGQAFGQEMQDTLVCE